MHRFWILMGLLLASGSLPTMAAEPTPGEQVQQDFPLDHKKEKKDKVMGYWLYLPKDYVAGGEKKFPLMLFLHGSGERGDDLDKVLVHGPPKLVAAGQDFPCIIVSPQCPEHQIWNSDILSRLLDDIEEHYAVDRQRICVTGLSMGGFATWSLGASTPFRFSALAPICGGGRPEWSFQLKHVPISVYHGEIDPGVKLVESQKMVDAIKKDGGNIQFTVYPGVEHDSWTQTYENPAFFEWILSQVRQ